MVMVGDIILDITDSLPLVCITTHTVLIVCGYYITYLKLTHSHNTQAQAHKSSLQISLRMQTDEHGPPVTKSMYTLALPTPHAHSVIFSHANKFNTMMLDIIT